MRRWLRRLGIAVAALLLLLVLFTIVEHLRGSRALKHRLKELEAKSEKLSIAAVEPKHPDAGQNGFLDLAGLTNRLSRRRPTSIKRHRLCVLPGRVEPV